MRLLLPACCVVLLAGCGRTSLDTPSRDPMQIYEAVLRHSLPAEGDGQGVYVQIDSADPPADMLARLRERWPALRPASEAGAGKARRVHVEELKWLGQDIAEVRGGWSDGIDGAAYVFRVVRKGVAWVVESSTTEAVS